jgi:hypothetical protein
LSPQIVAFRQKSVHICLLANVDYGFYHRALAICT